MSTLQSAVSAMRHWNGGGTNQAEGLAWGWRVLSPGEPFTQGRAYNNARDNVRKVIVLMSDGENATVGTDAVMVNDYSAYNYVGFWSEFASGNALTRLLFGVLHGVLPQSSRQIGEVHAIHQLVLVEAREDDGLASARRIDVLLKALGADLLHHALHGRVDAGDPDVVVLQIRRERAVARRGHGRHHPIGSDGNDSIDALERHERRASGHLPAQ